MTEASVSRDELAELLPGQEPWLDKRGLARHYSCSVSSIENALAQGMPHRRIFGRPKFQVTTVQPWLEAHGYIESPAPETSASVNGAAPRERPAPDTER